MKKITVAVVAIAAMLAMAAVPGPALAEYKIGAIFATTGGASMLGLPEKNTAEMLVDELNAKGGINGEKVKLFLYDTEADPTKAVNAVKKLISKDQVDVIIGPTTSGVSMAIIPEIEKAKVPLISCAAAVSIVVPVKPYVFKTPQTDIMAVEKIYTKLQADGIKKIALITVSNGFGDSGRVQLQNLAGNYGLSIVADERYGANDTNMTVQLTKIKASDAQAIICWGTNPGPAVVAKNRKELGITRPLYNSHGVASKAFIEGAEGAAEGTFLPAGKLLVVDQLADSDPQKKVLAGYKAAYEARWGGSVNTFGGHAWDAFYIAVMAIENAAKAGKVTHASIRDEIEKIKDFVGTGGIFNFSADDHNGLTKEGFVLVKIENGDWKLAE
ncbi:MAG: ABC transporter substrate-binding protein [bacterium]|nr:MAG: ABC transporter substrate-binding protein [bacterium]